MTNNTWQITPIGEQIELLTDYTANGSFAGLKQNVQYYNQSNYAALVRTTDLEKKIFAPERFTDKKGYDFLKKSSLIGGEIVLANVGSIGKVYRVPQYHLPMTLAPNMYLIRFKKGIDKNYAFQYLTSQIFQRKLLSNVASTTLSAINKSNLRSITIPVPPLGVQQRIGDILSSIDEAIQKTDQIIQKSEELKSGLMNELLTKGIGHSKFKKTKLGEIPEEWDIVSLQDLINTGFIKSHLDGNHGELYPKSSEFTEEGIPYISANNLKSNRVDFNGSKYLSVSRAKQFKKGVALDGDVLFAHNATVGPVAMLKTNYSFVILSTSLTYYRCDVSKLNPEYLMNYMQSEIFKAQYERVMSQTTRNQVPITAQRVLLHVIPPIDEQTEIAKMLSSVDATISKNNSEKTELIKLKNGLMHDIFNQKVQIN